MKYVIKKFITMLITVFFVSFFVFIAFQIIPGDPATAMLGTEATPDEVAALRVKLGLDRPILVRYGEWLIAFFFGDMGKSYSYGISVKEMIGNKIPITVTLTLMSFLMIVCVSIPLGIYLAEHKNSPITRFIDGLNRVIMAVPAFFTGIMLTFIFGLVFRLFTPGGYVSYERNLPDFLYYLLYPAIAIALPKIAMTVKLLKSALLNEAELDYVRTAFSRGNTTRQVIYKHILKNALIPVITFLGMTLSDIVAGSIIIEQVFSIPGIGRLLITSISNRDYPVALSIISMVAFIVIFINFLVDLLYKYIDPRTEG
ncbi:MAG: ABC transporter permease [Lachnospiraceae bacterium]|nr:ABC transporter permease [Lachnospiraceae bacterium]